jgi:hypothetical protein
MMTNMALVVVLELATHKKTKTLVILVLKLATQTKPR